MLDGVTFCPCGMISEATNTFFLNFKSEWDNVVPICKSLEALNLLLPLQQVIDFLKFEIRFYLCYKVICSYLSPFFRSLIVVNTLTPLINAFFRLVVVC